MYLLTFVVSLCIRTKSSSPIHLLSGHLAELAYIWPVIRVSSDTDITGSEEHSHFDGIDKDLFDVAIKCD
jgi:hypothetical protein